MTKNTAINTSLCFGDLKMSHVEELRDTPINRFIVVKDDEVILNPDGQGDGQVITDKANGITYLSAALKMVTQYSRVTIGTHIMADLRNNRIHLQGVGYILHAGTYRRADAKGQSLMVSRKEVGGNDPERSLFEQYAMDDMLQYKIVVKLTDPSLVGYKDYIQEVLTAPDVATAMGIVQAHIRAAREHKNEYRNIKWETIRNNDVPDVLMATLDGKLVDLMQQPAGIKLQAVDASTGEVVRKSTFTWRPMPQACRTVEQHMAKGRVFRKLLS